MKVVLITGTSSGIGRAAVEAFAQAGWNVAATMRSPKPELFARYPNVKMYALDVTDEATIAAAFEHVVKDFGQLDVVVNNAGYGVDGVFEAISDEEIQKQFDTNVFGLMRVTRHAAQLFREQKSGVIVQVASFGGRISFPLYSIYNSTKWAVEGFSEGLSYELAPFGVRVKIIEPGIINTEFYGAGRQHVAPPASLGYDEFVEKVTRVSQGSGRKGDSPEVVARMLVKAATDTSPRLRYVVGRPAPAIMLLRRLLPDRLLMRGIKVNFKL